MKKAIFAAMAALGIVGSAAAQGYPYNFSVRGGVVFPIDRSYSNISSSFFGLGAEYTLDTSFIKGGETFLSLDYISKTLGRDKGSVLPFAINQRFFLGNQTFGARSYYYIGLGGAVVDFNGSDTVLGARFGVGRELNTQFFTEATLFVNDKSNGLRTTSFGLYLGFRF
jgi:hypothetical protein